MYLIFCSTSTSLYFGCRGSRKGVRSQEFSPFSCFSCALYFRTRILFPFIFKTIRIHDFGEFLQLQACSSTNISVSSSMCRKVYFSSREDCNALGTAPDYGSIIVTEENPTPNRNSYSFHPSSSSSSPFPLSSFIFSILYIHISNFATSTIAQTFKLCKSTCNPSSNQPS